jgi:hypothetical protein
MGLHSRGARPEKTDQRPRSDGPRDDGGDRVAARQRGRKKAMETAAFTKRCPNFAACERAEQKKSRNFALRAALENVATSFRTVCFMAAR